MQSLQERIKKESEFYSNNQKEMQKLLENRQKLDAQISDNNLVKSVLDDLELLSFFIIFTDVHIFLAILFIKSFYDVPFCQIGTAQPSGETRKND